ncbi:MAG: polysulfide reductase NrfD, partial [Chloroflexota bacterium]|nr:polysulfide reductase NrfD [Chloroflexota bacterium]
MPGYYGLPVIHKPHWKWQIICYFFLGGLSGASYAVATVASLAGGEANRRISRVGYYLAFIAFVPSPVLLTLDLGRPERFHHMLRVLKWRSPMSIGSWLLLSFGGVSFLSALLQARDDGLLGRANLVSQSLCRVHARTVGVLGLPLGLLLSGYTGVLVAATAVPIWTKNHLLMGPLFLSSAVSSASSAISLALSLGGGSHEVEGVERLEVAALSAELALLGVNRARLGPTVARPLIKGRTAALYKLGVLRAGVLLPLSLHARRRLWRSSPSRRES